MPVTIMLLLIRASVVVLVLLTILTGVAYPLAVTGLAAVVFPFQAQGSVVLSDGKAVGSTLIGQAFSSPKYFWSRPSATGPYAYKGDSGSGSNLGPTNPALMESVDQRIKALKAADPENQLPIPIDLVTASGSGLDPHISVAAAEYQLARVARARGISSERVRNLIARHTEGRTLGVLGESRVNVLLLNIDLDQPDTLAQK